MNTKLSLWTVYASPRDYPGQFVARRFVLDVATGDVCVSDTLDGVRKMLPRGLMRLMRDHCDEAHIVEVWL